MTNLLLQSTNSRGAIMEHNKRKLLLANNKIKSTLLIQMDTSGLGSEQDNREIWFGLIPGVWGLTLDGSLCFKQSRIHQPLPPAVQETQLHTMPVN